VAVAVVLLEFLVLAQVVLVVVVGLAREVSTLVLLAQLIRVTPVVLMAQRLLTIPLVVVEVPVRLALTALPEFQETVALVFLRQSQVPLLVALAVAVVALTVLVLHQGQGPMVAQAHRLTQIMETLVQRTQAVVVVVALVACQVVMVALVLSFFRYQYKHHWQHSLVV